MHPRDDALPREQESSVDRVVFVFLDGVGIGPADADHNPFLQAEMPWFSQRFGSVPTLAEPAQGGESAWAFPMDATLGVDGTPQSGTGQTALLTGRNGAEIFGRHFGPWVPVALRPLMTEHNLLRRAVDRGLSTTFANAYPTDWSRTGSGKRPAGPPLAAQSVALLTRDHRHLARGDAVASEIVNTGWRIRLGFSDLPSPRPEEAGANLARVAAEHRLTFFAHYSTDYAGHRGGMSGSIRALERVDRFLSGLEAQLGQRSLVIVTSDHGNVEDTRAGHTRNPALGLLIGPDAARRARSLRSIMDVPAAILGWLDPTGGA